MAIGDSFALIVGAAATVRQPSSGVFEELSAIVTLGTTDEVQIRNVGGNTVAIAAGSIASGLGDFNSSLYNMAIKIGNAAYLQKAGTTDQASISGVQVDA